MIERIHIKNFRMLKDVTVDLPRFAVLVGKNSTGKTTLIKAIEFVREILLRDLASAIEVAVDGSFSSYDDLCFDPSLPIEITLLFRAGDRRFSYAVTIGPRPFDPFELDLLSESLDVADAVAPTGWRTLRSRINGRSYLYMPDEVSPYMSGAAGESSIPSAPEHLLPEVVPARNLLRSGISSCELESRSLRLPSPARSPKTLNRDGSSLASAARALRERDLPAFRQWVAHVAGAVEGLEEIDIWDRPEDRASVLRAKFQGRNDWVPSNFLSDGTLRLLALSLLAYAEKPDDAGIVLVEEPENGLHPLAMQYVFDALAGMEHTQVFVATHSPIFLAQATLDDALCFSRNADGSASIVRGSDLAKEKGWGDEVRLETLFAAGVLS